MNPYWDNGVSTLYQADARAIPLPDASVHCVVTSPPYWGLRDYGLGQWEGGDAECDHEQQLRDRSVLEATTKKLWARETYTGAAAPWPNNTCGLCGAVQQAEGIGLEATLGEWVANIVAVMREVRRVLRDDGTVWLNLGDAYRSGNGLMDWNGSSNPVRGNQRRGATLSMPPKNLMGQPWRVAFALQDDGWILRSAVVWHKPNPMPESVTDRPASAYEMVFLLTKQGKYFYDSFAVQQEAIRDTIRYGKDVYGLQLDLADEQVPDQTERPESGQSLQGLRDETDGRMAGRQQRTGERGESSIQGKRTRTRGSDSLPKVRQEQGSTEEISGVREGEGPTSEIQADTGAQDSIESLRRLAKGQGQPQEVSNNVEGQGELGPWISQTPDENGRVINPDGGRMDGDMPPVQESLRLLSEEKAADDGPYHSREQGRGTHEDEHSTGVSKLQRKKGQQDKPAGNAGGPNLRNVWTIPTQGRPDAHFATFPDELPRRCILAGTSERGVCADCGSPWTRLTETTGGNIGKQSIPSGTLAHGKNTQPSWDTRDGSYQRHTLGWQPTCDHGADTVPATVLDPFVGSGTTVAVAQSLGRRGVGLDLNEEYLGIAAKRIGAVTLPMVLRPEEGP